MDGRTQTDGDAMPGRSDGAGPGGAGEGTGRPLRILVLGLNYAPEPVGIAVYTTGLAEALAARGHQVAVVAGKPYYPAWSVPALFRGGWRRDTNEAGVAITRVAHYVPARPSGARRILHHMSFAASALWPMLVAARRFRPDLVFTAAPSLIAAPVAGLAARLAGARSWLHIQDFEVEAAVATGLVGGGRLARWAGAFESRVLAGFDRVSSISPAMCRRCIAKGVAPERVVEFRNWADIEAVRPLAGPSPFRAEWGIATEHVALYSGNIANKQGIEIVVGAARRLAHRRDLTFVICGDGPNMEPLRQSAARLGNVVFRPLQPKERLGDLVGLATVHLLPQRAGAADLVLPSKLTNMLASGRAVVATADPGTGLAEEVEGCGLVVAPEDEEAFAEAIARLLDDPDLRAGLAAEARRRAETRWDRTAIIDGFEQTLRALVP